MNPEKQRIKIAETCGWHDCYIPHGLSPCGIHKGILSSNENFQVDLPNYLNDLNAIHEAEKVLTFNQVEAYDGYLDFVIAKANEGTPYSAIADRDYHATAAQRCEAFLKTLGLWEE